MYADKLYNGLQVESSFTPADPYSDLARLPFVVRKEMLEAARVLAPGAVFHQIVAQHSTVVANAITRSINNIR